MNRLLQIALPFIFAVATLLLTSCGDDDGPATFEEEVSITTSAGDIFGTLLRPNTTNAVPIVLIIAGSGPTDRDGNTVSLPGTNNSLKMIADELLLSNVASLRYDKRGVGASIDAANTEAGLTFNDYVTDAISWVKILRKDERYSSVGILGHSEGSLIGMIAASSAEVDFFISVAGAGVSADKIILEQLAGSSEGVIEYSAYVLSELRKGNTVSDIPPNMQFLFRESAQPYLTSWIQYDPSLEISRLDMPVAVIHGTRDIQVPVEQANILAESNANASLKIIDGMNHILKNAPEDPNLNLLTYTDPSIPLTEEFAKFLTDYLADLR
ncbi:MAG: alpha/beta hydrolase [Cyclobacteriaceae bacterium]